jgi:hypothetical protein
MMAQDQPTGVWLRDGNLIYMLEETGQYRKGVETLRNRATVQVVSDMHMPKAEVDALVERVHTLLVEDAKQSGADLMAKANAAREAFEAWVEKAYPVDAEVEFKPYPNISPKKGKILSSGVSDHGTPVVQVYYKGGYYRVDPFVNPITILTPEEVTE